MKFCCNQYAKKIDSTAISMKSIFTKSIIIASVLKKKVKDLDRETYETIDPLISCLYSICVAHF